MRVYIDISVFSSPTESYGVINGDMEMDVIPRVGESISFAFPINKEIMPLSASWFLGALKVTDITHRPTSSGTSVLVCLEPVILTSIDQCKALSDYMEKGFVLGTDEHQ